MARSLLNCFSTLPGGARNRAGFTINKTKSTNMKSKPMKSLLAKSAAIIAACAALTSAQAGTTGGKIIAPTVEPEVDDSLGMEAAIGYDSRYYFRGLWFSNHNVWTNISSSVPLTEALTLDMFGYYTDTATSLNYSELDLGASLTYDAGFASVSLGYTWFYFFNGFFGDGIGQDYAHEAFLSTTVPLGPINFNAVYAYDFFINASYAQVGLDSEIPVTDWLSIVPAAVIGYSIDGYYTFGTASNAFTHVGLNISFPITLSKTATLTPYIAANFSMEGREDLNTIEGADEVFGGVALSVTF